jgi:hypothetical protein
VLRFLSEGTSGSNYHLSKFKTTVIALSTVSEGADLLALRDEGLEDFFGMQVAFSESMFESDGITTFKFVIWIFQKIQ